MGLLKIRNYNGQLGCSLTGLGNRIFSMSVIYRQAEFVKLILAHKAFKETLRLYLDKGEAPSKYEVVEIMKNSNLYNIGEESTYLRRASTIIGWINWIIDQINE